MPPFFAFCSAVQRSALVSAASPFQLLKQEELKSSCLLDDVAIFLLTFFKEIYAAQTCMFVPLSQFGGLDNSDFEPAYELSFEH